MNAAPAGDHLVKAGRFLGTARTLLRAGDGEAVISACYYACLHVVEALLATRGIAADTHRGVRQLLSLHFIKDGPLTVELGRDYGRLMADRDLADYGLGAPLDLAVGANSVRLALSVLRPLFVARVMLANRVLFWSRPRRTSWRPNSDPTWRGDLYSAPLAPMGSIAHVAARKGSG